ncbi:stage III sporulation protein AF [Clostridium sp. Cult2]|uniref:stage III sporulation protein AF n=1 Tax=Clostridium sp. Cult2 TaxID=2079003 RepID=UPI001F01CCB9|nr:stage III sporulation protein AF [Clostridium sp. Cult2]
MKVWVKDIAIIFVLISIVEIALPNSNMKRYIDMVIGLLVIIVIITPFIKLIHKDFNMDREVFSNTVNQIKFEYRDNIELSSLQEEQIKKMYINKIKDEIQGHILGSTEYQVEEIIISIYEDEINYGEIKDIDIILKEYIDAEESTEALITVAQIENVEIGESKERTKNLQVLQNSEDIVNIINKNYNISKENIKVYINTTREGE